MHAPQIVFIVWVALSLGITMAQHGKPKEGDNNFFITLVSASFVTAIVWWGGFFN